MSNASTGASAAITVLMELDPMSVYRKAKKLVARRPEAASLVGEIVYSYSQLLDDLDEDFATLDEVRS